VGPRRLGGTGRLFSLRPPAREAFADPLASLLPITAVSLHVPETRSSRLWTNSLPGAKHPEKTGGFHAWEKSRRTFPTAS